MQVFEREAAVTEYEFVCTGDPEKIGWKSASRWRAKSPDALCAVLPLKQIIFSDICSALEEMSLLLCPLELFKRILEIFY